MIDYVFLMIIAFLAISLKVGLSASRRIDTFKKFAVGDKNFKTSVLVATIAATIYDGGMLVRDIESIYIGGLYRIPDTTVWLSFLIIGKYMSLRMKEFLHHLSIAESMGVLFGTTVRIITAVSGILLLAGFLATQIKVISEIVNLCSPLKSNIGIYITLGIILLYSMWGGIKSVTLTDVIQFITFGLLIVTLIFLTYQKIGSFRSVITLFTTHENFKINEVVGFHPKFRDTIALAIMWGVPMVTPDLMQRFYMASDVWQVRKMFYNLALVAFIVPFLTSFLGISLFSYNPTLNFQKLIPYLMNLYPIYWFKGIILIGILALAMSTADSNLNTSSVLFVHDIAALIKFPIKYKIWVARLFMVCMCIFSLWISFQKENLLELLITAFSFYMPIVVVPFVMAVFGFRPRSISVLISMVAGGLTVLIFQKLNLEHLLGITNDVVPAMFVNLFFLIGSYYLLPKVPGRGWVGIKEKEPLIQAAQERKRKYKACMHAIKHFYLKSYIKKLFPRERTISYIGFYILVISNIQLFTLNDPHLENYLSLFIILMLGGLFCFICPILSMDKNNLSVIYSWPLLIGSLLYLLPGYLMHIYDYQVLPSLVFLINIGIGLLLFPWFLVLSMVVMSLFIVHKMTSCDRVIDTLFSLQKSWGMTGWNFYLVLFFFLLFYIILIGYRQKLLKMIGKTNYLAQEKKLQASEKLSHMQYQRHLDLLTSHQGREDVLQDIYQDLDVLLKHREMGSQEKEKIHTSLDRLSSYRDFIQDRRYYERYHLLLNLSTISIDRLINDVVHGCSQLHLDIRPLIYQDTKAEQLECDAKKIEELICKSVSWLYNQEHQKNKRKYWIKLYIMDTLLGYRLNKTGSVYKELAAIAFVVTSSPQVPKIASVYAEETCQNVPIMLETASDLDKQRMLQIVDAHYGYFTDMEESEGVTLLQVLPVTLHAIRDAVMDRLPRLPDCKMIETEASLAKEREVLEWIISKTLLSRSYVKSTIDFMKKCHGDQLRHSGEPFYTHPLEVAAMVLRETQDPDVVVAALLHDVVEDSTVPLSYIRSRFGHAVSFIVNKVTHMDDSFRKKRLSKAEEAAQLEDVDLDIRVVQVKLADRLHNVRTLQYRSIEKQRELAEETLAFYAPLGARYQIPFVEEMKRLCENIVKAEEGRSL